MEENENQMKKEKNEQDDTSIEEEIEWLDEDIKDLGEDIEELKHYIELLKKDIAEKKHILWGTEEKLEYSKEKIRELIFEKLNKEGLLSRRNKGII